MPFILDVAFVEIEEMTAATAASVVKYQHGPRGTAPRGPIGARLNLVAGSFCGIWLFKMMEQRIHPGRALQIVSTVKCRVECWCRGTPCPPPQKRIMKQGCTGHAPAPPLLVELTEIEFPVESALEHGQPRRQDASDVRPNLVSRERTKDQTLDEKRQEFEEDDLSHGIDPVAKPTGMEPRWLVPRRGACAHPFSDRGSCAAP